ncbi:alcohol dehydrogenase catalytic domain-containing protein [Sphingobacterium sp. SGG-5]|uniref:alcohol dehydrogenase catalytic domain-containing protein n=1 Tax=Sphingobacterium sp. SGG-5 TaxID=2710881 RepID=UPI0013ED255A|nr:alcohol dehydrogenase catalytic domain-containing protein [Sphingobacterium sp. SGG-5]NGM61094.1 alcohol dehydrogenase catalytic domain-containing protein [Sphingobacterium sp. SGG-5]
MTKGYAAITDGKGHFSMEAVEVDQPAADEVLVQIKAAGLCHTDYDSLQWGREMILGHEGAGIVVAVGRNVQHLSEGDHVLLNWAIPCGFCFQCKTGNPNICENNSPVTGVGAGSAHEGGTMWRQRPISRAFHLGTLSEYTLVKEAAVVKNHALNMPFTAAAIIGCGVMTGYGSVMNAAKVTEGSTVVVIGAGGVGLNVIQGARLAKAGKIIVIDILEKRFAMAKKMGATHTITASKKDTLLLDAAKKVKDLLGGRGADYAFECTAIPALGAAPLAMVRNGGTAIQVSGIEQEINIDMNLFEWDKIYMNPLYGKCRPAIDFPAIIDHYEKKELFLDELVTRTYSLSQLPQAFDDLLQGKNAKGVIEFV